MGNEEAAVPGRELGERIRALLPWFACLAVFGFGALALDGVVRAIAVGAFAASCVGAMLAITQVRNAVTAMRRWMGERESALTTFADDRAAAVARQFQWAVDELVRARAELRKAESLRVQAEERALEFADKARRDSDELRAAREKLRSVDGTELDVLREKIEQIERAFREEEHDRRIAERRARAAEERVADLTRTLRLVATTVSSGGENFGSPRTIPTGPLALDWTLEYDGTAHTLRLRSASADVRPQRARILDASGRLVIESAKTRRRSTEMLLRIPQSVAAAVESADWSAFQLEVQLDGEWLSAALVARAPVASDARPAAFRVVS